MDRAGRVAQGGPRYLMPRFEDGSSYGPGDPFYDQVAKTYTVDEWNGMSDDQRGAVLDRFVTDPDSGMSTNLSRSKANPLFDAFLAFDEFSSGSRQRGLFGGESPGLSTRAAPPRRLRSEFRDDKPEPKLPFQPVRR